MAPRPFSTQSAACPPCCSQPFVETNGCPWVDDMLALCGGLLFVGVGRHELAAMAPCRRGRRHLEHAAESRPERPDIDPRNPPLLRLVRN